MRLALASSTQMPSVVFDVNTLSRTTAPRVPAVRWTPTSFPDSSLSRMVLLRPPSSASDRTMPASSLASTRRSAEHVVGDAGVELHADGEAADRAVGDRHAVAARVEHAGALAEAVDEVTVEVDGDVRGADDDGDARALEDVVGESHAARDDLAAADAARRRAPCRSSSCGSPSPRCRRRRPRTCAIRRRDRCRSPASCTAPARRRRAGTGTSRRARWRRT